MQLRICVFRHNTLLFSTAWLLLIHCLVLPAGSKVSAEDVSKDPEKEKPKPSRMVDFRTDVMPILRRNCVPCHHENDSEGGLILDSHQAILRGGDDGLVLDRTDATNSRLLVRATDQEEPMPPEDNSVGANLLSKDQLDLITRWIEQGAKEESTHNAASISPATNPWRPIPESSRAIYALDYSPDGTYVAMGLANRAVVWDPHTHQPVAWLVDPSLGPNGVADIDMIHSIHISPDASRIATGGFKSVRIWKRTYQTDGSRSTAPSPLPSSSPEPWSFLHRTHKTLAIKDDESSVALVNAIGEVELWNTKKHILDGVLPKPEDPYTLLCWAGSSDLLVLADGVGRVSIWDTRKRERIAQVDTSSPVLSITVSDDGSSLLVANHSRVGHYHLVPAKDEQPASLDCKTESVGKLSGIVGLSVAWKPKAIAAIATQDSKVHLVDLKNNQALRVLAHGAVVDAICFSANTTTLRTGGRDGVTKLWAWKEGKQLSQLQGTLSERLQQEHNQSREKRQKALLARLEKEAKDFEAQLKQEGDLIAKTVKDQEKQSTELKALEKKQDQAKLKTAATQEELDKAIETVSELSKSDKMPQKNPEKLDADVDDAKNADAKKASELKASAEKASELKASAVAAAKATETKIRTQLEADQKGEETATENCQKLTKAIAQQNQERQVVKDALKRLQKRIMELKDQLARQTRRLQVIERTIRENQQTFQRGGRGVIAVANGQDGKTWATLQSDGTVQVMQEGIEYPIASMQFRHVEASATLSFLGDHLVVVDVSENVQFRRQQPNWILERTIGSIDSGQIEGRVTSLAFHPNRNLLAIGCGTSSRSGNVKVFDIKTGDSLRQFDGIHHDSVLALTFSPDGELIASASADKLVHLIDTDSGSVVKSLEGHTGHMMAVDWNRNGSTIATASADRSYRIWDLVSGKMSRKVMNMPHELTALKFVGDTMQFVVACGNGTVRLVDGNNVRTVRTFSSRGEFLSSVGVSPDGKRVVAGSQDGTLWVWDIANSKVVTQWAGMYSDSK